MFKNIGFADGKAYVDIYDPVTQEPTRKEISIVELYEEMQAQIQQKEKDITFYRGVANQWQDKYNEYKTGIETAVKIMEMTKGEI